MTLVLTFTSERAGVEHRIAQAESEPTLRSWCLLVARGAVRPHLRQDGLIAEVNVGASGPVSPYRCHLILDFSHEAPGFYQLNPELDALADPERLRTEARAAGTYNVIASDARAGELAERLWPAFWT